MGVTFRRICIIVAAAAILSGLSASTALAQGGISIEAVAGKPFGVGRITIELPKAMLPEPLGIDGLMITDKDARVLYPAIDKPGEFLNIAKGLIDQIDRPIGRMIGGFLNQPQTPIKAYFLFVGNDPLEVTVHARQPIRRMVVPGHNPEVHRAWLRQWWEQYAAPTGGLFQKTIDYPPLVENYLKSMLSRRIGLALPEDKKEEPWRQQFDEEIGAMFGTEKIRIAIERQRMLGEATDIQPADRPVPGPIAVPRTQYPELTEEVKIEPIAMRVPVECIYIRFGSFSNFLWMQDTMARFNGDMKNLVARRGLDYSMSKRIERQLVVKQSALSRMLGDTVVADVAIIGTDLFFREGAAFGMLFQARNSFLLGRDFSGKRAEAVKNDSTITEQTLTIGEKKVSYLSSPDGSVRSYYVVDGDFHFITTSKALVARFLEAASGKNALGTSEEFRHARSVMPIERADTIFAYFSEACGLNMIGPRYRIEMARRLIAVADIELAQMAMLASATEGLPGETIEELMVGGFLPTGFDRRPDGSRTVLADDVYDSLRGHRGYFLPVPDVPLGKVSRSEAAAYNKFIEQFIANWGRIDPMMAGIKREALAEGHERVVIDMLASPFDRKHSEFVSKWIGMADDKSLAPMPNDIIAGEMISTKGRLFGGIWDVGPSEASAGQLLPIGQLRNMLVGYVGTTGQMGFLGLLDNWSRTMRRVPARRRQVQPLVLSQQSGPFTVFSLHRDVMATVASQLRYEKAERPAQVRLRVGDVSRARVTPSLNSLAYGRTRETSLGNLRLLHSMTQQLHVPGPDCLVAAELLLDAKLVCPLGGQYVFQETAGGGRWTSTAVHPVHSQGLLKTPAPPGYAAPPLSWFRGLNLDVAMTENRLSAHADVVMLPPDMPEPEPPKAQPPQPEPAEESDPAKKVKSLLDSLLPR